MVPVRATLDARRARARRWRARPAWKLISRSRAARCGSTSHSPRASPTHSCICCGTPWATASVAREARGRGQDLAWPRPSRIHRRGQARALTSMATARIDKSRRALGNERRCHHPRRASHEQQARESHLPARLSRRLELSTVSGARSPRSGRAWSSARGRLRVWASRARARPPSSAATTPCPPCPRFLPCGTPCTVGRRSRRRGRYAAPATCPTPQPAAGRCRGRWRGELAFSCPFSRCSRRPGGRCGRRGRDTPSSRASAGQSGKGGG